MLWLEVLAYWFLIGAIISLILGAAIREFNPTHDSDADDHDRPDQGPPSNGRNN